MMVGGKNLKCKKNPKQIPNKIHTYALHVLHLVTTAARLEHLACILLGACSKAEGSDFGFLTLWCDKTVIILVQQILLSNLSHQILMSHHELKSSDYVYRRIMPHNIWCL